VSALPLRERTNGRWRAILPALGIHPEYLTGKNGPCPMCGGRDRWRFDNKQGDGTWICTHCGAGQGIKLVRMFTGIADYSEIATRIERIIGEAPRETIKQERSEAAKRAVMNELWIASRPVRAGDPVDLWMHHRGLALPTYPDCLRTCSSARYSGPPVAWHPAMLAKVTDPAGKPVMIHRTYLTAAGTKAPVDKVRMFCAGKIPPGSAVRLTAPWPTIGIAEGIETALAAAKLFDVPTWAALNADLLSKFEPPPGTDRLVIFGDNDANGTGQRAAYTLASRMAPRMRVEVKIPETPDTDWNDG
jgi:putative DNA primase/helicase